jgi:hypothetical protein
VGHKLNKNKINKLKGEKEMKKRESQGGGLSSKGLLMKFCSFRLNNVNICGKKKCERRV